MKQPSPNTRMQRTRSSASPPRSPLMRNPLGGTKLLGAAFTSVLLACSSGAPVRTAESQVCVGKPVEFGTVTIRSFAFRVLDSLGKGVAARVRFRRDAFIIQGGGWEQTVSGDDGWFAVADWPDGRTEVEVCGANSRPLHGFVDVVPTSPVSKIALSLTLKEDQ